MYDIFDAEAIAAYSLGQRRGFLVGVVCGAAMVIYAQRYTIAKRRARTAGPKTQYNQSGRPF